MTTKDMDKGSSVLSNTSIAYTITLSMPVDNVIKNANSYELAQNHIHHNLQHKLNERTAERDAFRYACQMPLTLIGIPNIHHGRSAYLEVVQFVGPEIFDDLPDRFKIRALIVQERQIQAKLENL